MTLPTTLLRALFLAAVASLLIVPCVQATENTITFDNQSGEATLVKIVGPTTTQVHIAHTSKESVTVSDGDYYILVRYGSAEDAYRYTKGDSFAIAPPSGQFQEVSITLHKVVGGTYQSHSIDSVEFEEAGVAATPSKGKRKNEITIEVTKVKRHPEKAEFYPKVYTPTDPNHVVLELHFLLFINGELYEDTENLHELDQISVLDQNGNVYKVGSPSYHRIQGHGGKYKDFVVFFSVPKNSADFKLTYRNQTPIDLVTIGQNEP